MAANPKKKLQAYAVFGGGGVRGVGFAGALAAAESLGIEFIGFGGVSAGSIIALLAAAGYSGNEIANELMTDDVLLKLLDDQGDELVRLRDLLFKIQLAQNSPSQVMAILRLLIPKKNRAILGKILGGKHGLYTGSGAVEILQNLLVRKNPDLPASGPISFNALHDVGRKVPLRVLAANLTTRREVVFPDPSKPDNDPWNASVVDAVRASMAVPFVYEPYPLGTMRLVDGGALNGLPVFLFESDFRQSKIPIFAFELVDSARTPGHDEHLTPSHDSQTYDFFSYVQDLISTASSSADETIRITTESIYPIRLDVPEGAAMDFGRDKARLRRMIDRGRQTAHDQLVTVVKLEQWTAERRARLTDNVRLILQAMVHHIEDPKRPLLANCRAYIMLRTDSGKRQVRYHFRVQSDAERAMLVGLTEGPSGVAWGVSKPVLISLDDYRAKASPGEVLPPLSQKSIISVTLKEYGGTAGDLPDDHLPLVGTLSVDSSSPMEDDAVPAFNSHLEEIIRRWAEVISRQLMFR